MRNYLKFFLKKMWNLVIPKSENHNLRRKTTIKTVSDFNRRKKPSFIADNKLQNDQEMGKIEAKFYMSIFI